ncbi:hypothetical protein MHYP_G00099740 [Metynnis hypsauchen]
MVNDASLQQRQGAVERAPLSYGTAEKYEPTEATEDTRGHFSQAPELRPLQLRRHSGRRVSAGALRGRLGGGRGSCSGLGAGSARKDKKTRKDDRAFVGANSLQQLPGFGT